ncbi:MAG: OB-fold domain-containing protein [Dehalococcoidia bacterium]
MSAADKPVPVPNEDNAPYWEGARQRRLVLPRCTACGQYYARPRIVCAVCHGEQFAWTPVSGRGVIHSYTVVHQTTSPGFQDELPYVIVHVTIAEQPECVVTANLIGVFDADRLTIDLPVVVDFEDRGDQTLPQFRLA